MDRWHQRQPNLTIFCLQVLESTEGDPKGGLAASMDHCVTAAGRRKLRAWLCQPLACPQAIRARQDAVQDLMEGCCEAAGAARRQFAGQCAGKEGVHVLICLNFMIGLLRSCRCCWSPLCGSGLCTHTDDLHMRAGVGIMWWETRYMPWWHTAVRILCWDCSLAQRHPCLSVCSNLWLAAQLPLHANMLLPTR